MPKPRKSENKGLPARWRVNHGAYYFQVPPGLESRWDGKKIFRLGKTLPEAYALWASRISNQDKAETIAQLLDRYLLEVVPTKAPSNRATNIIWIKQIRSVFGDLPMSQIRPQHVYQYVDKRSQKKTDSAGKVTGGKIAAHREMEVYLTPSPRPWNGVT